MPCGWNTELMHGAAGAIWEKIQFGYLMGSFELWPELYVLTVLTQRYLEAAPRILLILKREFQTT